VFVVLFAPVAALGVEAWVARLSAWLAPAPARRAGAFLLVALLLIAAYAVVSGLAVRPVAGLALIGALMLVFAGTRAVAARPVAHAWRIVLALLALWIPIELDLVHGLPLPAGGGLESGRLLAFSLGLALLIVVAPLPDVGYTFRLRRSDVTDALVAFAAFAAIAIPLGLGIGFLRWEPRSPEPLVWFQGAIGIYFLTAIPEELLFRGGFQNLLEKRWPGGRARMWSLVIGSIVFGAAHLDNPPAPNFRYMLLATLAGVAYGWVWQRTRRISAAALTHAAVDWIWGLALGG
jgi:membrane protease YdiL (CAAX protease family)